MSTPISRREFIAVATTTAAVASLGTFTPRASAGHEGVIRHAVIGMGGRAREHVRQFNDADGCEIVAVCDVDPSHLASVPEQVSKHMDYREILEDASIHSISIATPDHWHTPIAAAGLLAGKHVYVEKPCSHTVAEGKYLEEVAAHTGKVVQHGTQSRSGEGYQASVKFMREGGLGKVRVAKAINHQLRPPIGRAEEKAVPEGVDYDMWLGCAPVRPFTENRFHYNWHWFWDYGAGDIANDGVHHIDLARWGLGVEFPNAISASGGQFFYDDDHETPDTQIVTYEYDDCHLIYEMRLWTNYKLEGHENGAIFYGDKGRLDMGRQSCIFTDTDGNSKELGGGPDMPGHVKNYLDNIRSKDAAPLTAPVRDASVSSSLCYLGNIATRLDRKLHFDPETLTCKGDDEANAMLTKAYREGYELPKIG